MHVTSSNEPKEGEELLDGILDSTSTSEGITDVTTNRPKEGSSKEYAMVLQMKSQIVLERG